MASPPSPRAHAALERGRASDAQRAVQADLAGTVEAEQLAKERRVAFGLHDQLAEHAHGAAE